MKIIGHRGARGLAPENTLASLRKALEHGVDEVEFDVRVTEDGVPILLHDDHLADATGQKLAVSDYTLEELQAHKPDLTTLADALKGINDQVVAYVEIKGGEPTAAVVTVLKTYNGRLLLGSKSQKTLRELHAALPEIPTIVIEPWSGVRATWRARQLGTKRLAMNQLWLWRGFIAPLTKRGWQLSAYTVNDPAKIRRWRKYGLYGVVTDYPDRFEK